MPVAFPVLKKEEKEVRKTQRERERRTTEKMEKKKKRTDASDGLGVLEDVAPKHQLDPRGLARPGSPRGRRGLLEVGDRGLLGGRELDGEGRGRDGFDGDFHFLVFFLARGRRKKKQ